MPAPDSIPQDDTAFLDWVFEQAVALFEEGLPVSVEALVRGHEALQAEVLRLVDLAKEVTLGMLRDAPAVPGYTIVARLGEGGMGTVYLARQDRLAGREVALKVLPASCALSDRARERFRMEAEAIARLQHPHVVAIYDVIHHGSLHAYAMEYVEGRSLADVIHRLKRGANAVESGERRVEQDVRAVPPPGPPPRPEGGARTRSRKSTDTRVDMGLVSECLGAPEGAIPERTPITWVCRVGVCIARALGAVHRTGFLHRDVKPSNILIRRDGTPLLSDFGLVRESDSLMTQPGTFAGTPGYAPPEQLRGELTSLDARSDVYQLGATLYHALTLQVPFHGGDPVRILQQIEVGPAPLRRLEPKAPRDLETIVAKAMDPDPARRYATADEFADDLERMLNLRPVRARRIGPVGRAIRFVRRNRAKFAAAVAASVLTLMLATVAVIYVFFVPRWFDEHVREARLELIGPNQQSQLFNALVFQARVYDLVPADVPRETLDEALAEYDRALRLRPWDDAIRIERDLMRLVRDVVGFAKHRADPSSRPIEWPTPSTPLQAAAPYLSDYLSGHRIGTRHGQVTEQTLAGASPTELRLLGIASYLLLDVETAIAAFSRLDAVAEADPLVDGAMGLVYILLEEPARAYPRLREACEAFPGVGFLFTAQADAAIQCGDLDRAGRLLAQAANMERLPSLNGLERIQARHHAASGQDGLARALYEEFTQPDKGSGVLNFDYAQFLESRGDLGGAVLHYAEAFAGPDTNNPRFHRPLLPVMERWWGSLSDGERVEQMRRALDLPFPSKPSLTFWLDQYALRHRTCESFPDRPLPAWLTAPLAQRSRQGVAQSGVLRHSRAGGNRPWEGGQDTASPREPVPSSREPVPSSRETVHPEVPPDPLQESPAPLLPAPHSSPPISPSGVSRSAPPDFAALSAADSSPFFRGLSLLELAERMEVNNVARWQKMRTYSPTLKTLQCVAWLCPDAKAASDAVEWLHDVTSSGALVVPKD